MKTAKNIEAIPEELKRLPQWVLWRYEERDGKQAKVEVPTARALVMTTARETVKAAFMAAGRPDYYNEDLIYYVTDEQFGYVAYLSGFMVREKPAACFYMGAFFAAGCRTKALFTSVYR